MTATNKTTLTVTAARFSSRLHSTGAAYADTELHKRTAFSCCQIIVVTVVTRARNKGQGSCLVWTRTCVLAATCSTHCLQSPTCAKIALWRIVGHVSPCWWGAGIVLTCTCSMCTICNHTLLRILQMLYCGMFFQMHVSHVGILGLWSR